MSTQENNGSIFSNLKKGASHGPAPARREALPPPPPQQTAQEPPPQDQAVQPPPPRPANFPPPPLPPPPAADVRIPALETALRTLQDEIQILKARPEPEAPPPPTGAVEEFGPRLVRAESLVEELRRQVAACDEGSKARDANAAPITEIKNIDLRLGDLAVSYDGLKRTFAREGELAARLEQAESALAEFRVMLPGQQAQLKTRLAELAPKEELDALRVNISGALGSLEEVKKKFAQYSEEFSGVERECRKALGEMQGYARSAGEKPLAEKFDEYLKESVSRLSVKLAEVETALHAGLAEMSGKLLAGEILYKKMFREAEDRLAKSVEPKLESIDGQLKWLRENMIRLSDEYTVVTERKIRALEGKYSAFEAIARRMDAIDAALKMGGRVGLP